MGINLSQTSAAARAQQRRDKMFTRSIWVAVLILLVVAGAYAALRVYNGTLQGEITAVDNKIAQHEAEVSQPKMIEVANAIFRTRSMERNYAPNSVVLSLLETVSSAMVDGVVVDKYAYDVAKKAISVDVDMITTDLLAIARQVAALKDTKVFATVTVENVSRDPETGEVQFTLSMSAPIANTMKKQ